MAEIPKVVFSTTLEPPLTWANTELVAEDAVTALRRMKEEGSAPMRTLGSISLTKVLLREGLVDYLHLVVFPDVTGQSELSPIFADWPDLDLELVGSSTYDGRMQRSSMSRRSTDRRPRHPDAFGCHGARLVVSYFRLNCST